MRAILFVIILLLIMNVVLSANEEILTIKWGEEVISWGNNSIKISGINPIGTNSKIVSLKVNDEIYSIALYGEKIINGLNIKLIDVVDKQGSYQDQITIKIEKAQENVKSKPIKVYKLYRGEEVRIDNNKILLKSIHTRSSGLDSIIIAINNEDTSLALDGSVVKSNLKIQVLNIVNVAKDTEDFVELRITSLKKQPAAQPITQEQQIRCDGCILPNSNCVPVGTRTNANDINSYCSVQNQLLEQKTINSECLNDFECRVDKCTNYRCGQQTVSSEDQSSFLQRILDWLTSVFL